MTSNPKALDKARAEANMARNSQGGSILEGSSGNPQSHCQSPSGIGHGEDGSGSQRTMNSGRDSDYDDNEDD
jgi:hypothetical protein